MSLVKLNIKGISYSQTQNGAYALILNEVDGDRKLPIVIGAFEAQSIAIALEKEISPPRPLTHDLFKNFADRFVADLPLGFKQKLAFSIAVIHNPKIVFLDEPTSGVDPITRRQFWGLIYEASNRGITVFVTTHYLEEADGTIKQGDTVGFDLAKATLTSKANL